jgi:restriction endonuclease S subunit
MTTNTTQSGNLKIPKLRFPGFKGEWEKKKLKQFLQQKIREIPKPENLYMAIGIRSHFKGTFQKPDSDPRKIAMEKLFVVKENDLIVNITFAWEGAVAIAKKEDEGGLVSHRFPTYVFDEKITTHKYFQFIFPNEKIKYRLTNISPGGAGRNRVLNKKDFLKLSFYLPSIPEQQKIADFLGSVDEYITNLKKQKELLEKYKKGMMQKIFSQEIRFPGFSGEWEEKKLGEVCEITSSKRVYLSDYVNSGIPFFRGKEISELKKSKTASDILYIKESKFSEFKSKFGAPKKDDILITAVGTLGNIYRVNLDYDFYFKDGNLIWLKNPTVNSKLLEILLDHYKRELLKGVIGSTQKALTIIGIKKVKLPIPSLPEQQKIADFLCSIDNLIEAKSAEIEKTEEWKKGVMQGVFA